MLARKLLSPANKNIYTSVVIGDFYLFFFRNKKVENSTKKVSLKKIENFIFS